MYPITRTEKELLPEVAKCHCACFPTSFSTRLGANYVSKTLDWFLGNDQRFLFHIEVDRQVVGYCGGFIPRKRGDGSSSGMLQHAFSEAIQGLIKKPWILFHPEVVQQYPFLWKNILKKFSRRKKTTISSNTVKPFTPHVGLVVIGVHPNFRGTGIVKELMKEFDLMGVQYNQHNLVLTVKKNNTRAVKAYEKFDWHISEENKDTYLMRKQI